MIKRNQRESMIFAKAEVGEIWQMMTVEEALSVREDFRFRYQNAKAK